MDRNNHYPYANMKATRQFFDQMPISHADKEKIAHLNVERLFAKLWKSDAVEERPGVDASDRWAGAARVA